EAAAQTATAKAAKAATNTAAKSRAEGRRPRDGPWRDVLDAPAARYMIAAGRDQSCVVRGERDMFNKVVRHSLAMQDEFSAMRVDRINLNEMSSAIVAFLNRDQPAVGMGKRPGNVVDLRDFIDRIARCHVPAAHDLVTAHGGHPFAIGTENAVH